ncbi:hypothetical protein IMZ08_17720 [Bacillus luteolus]|uniref:Uncharacterized protein n=1 Tax=Litchfieldia luteola TaxID=682179 RepID=A0ABR9QMZ8_9BACI|nr:hypothetical protein [Cytobacillus luteolus]MBE4909877.1 hypothetical protein [Cytobacillus luteolus]MBP1942573.1 hypothetical protein [Cytobacillus luteolus]
MGWIIVILVVASFLVFGLLVDRKTDRYKSIEDKNIKEGIETIKDDYQKQNHPNKNQQGPF